MATSYSYISPKNLVLSLLSRLSRAMANLEARRVFITGGSGLVGYQCALTFKAAGWKVISTHCDFATPETVKYDSSNPSCPENFDVKTFAPNLIIHSAAFTHVDQCEADPVKSHSSNVKAVKHMAELAKLHSANLVFISSDYVFDGVHGPYAEDATPRPLNVYGKHKLEAENLLLQNSEGCIPPMSVMVLRVTNVYGEDAGRNKNFVSRIAGNAQRSTTTESDTMILKLPSDQYATPIDAADIATIIEMLVSDDKSGLYHVASPEYLSRVQLASKVLKHVPGHNVEIVPVQTQQFGQTAQRPLKGGLLCSRIQSEYPHFVFRTVDEFLQRTLRNNTYSGRALPGGYSQYDKPEKHRYAPNKFEAYGEEEIEAVVECLRDGWLAPGPRTEEFEKSVSRLYGKEMGLMVNSGSAANLIALNAFGFKSGDEVVTPACTFSTTVAPLVQLGVKPIFVDVEDGTYVPSVEAVINAITPNTVLIWLPNLVGAKPDWEELRKRTGLPLWEDSCDTITCTSVSDVSITSFYASHMITAGGGGGMIMANDDSFVKKCRMYRDWGRIGNNNEDMNERFAHNEIDGIPYDGKFLYGVIGYNCKSTEMNAAFGNVQLTKLSLFRKIRRDNFERMLENLNDTRYFGLPKEREKFDWLAFPLTCPDRARLLKFLEENNVQTRVTFSGNITRHPAYRELFFESQGGDANFPISDKVMAQGFLIGCHHGASFKHVDRVCKLLKAFERKMTALGV